MRQRKSSFAVDQIISIVVPAYNQEKTIVRDVLRIEKAIQELGYKYEIIVVNDGSTDNTLTQLRKLRSSHISTLSYDKNEGKGHAIRFGMSRAKGDIIGFIDAGMDIDTKGFVMLLNHMDWYNADVIVGSKMHPVSKINYPLWRKIVSWGYRSLTKRLFGFKIKDTQVGLKFFRKKVVKDVIPLLLVKKYAFDIEILALSYYLGYTRIYEAPVDIDFKSNTITSKNLWKTMLHMFWDTLAVFYRLKITGYYNQKAKKKTSLHFS